MQEQRRYIRIAYSLKISFRLLKGFLGSSSDSDNISEGGIQLPIDIRFDIGDVLELKILASEWGKPVEAIAEVVWFKEQSHSRHPFLVGLRFVKIEPLSQEKIRKHIEKLSKKDEAGGVGWMK